MDYENINAEADLDDLNDSCTILLSRYRITNNFTEPFVLPGIINASDITGGSAGRPLSIPSFEMPDLEHIDDLSLVRLDQLETFDVPKLMSARAIRLGSDASMALEMPALEEVSVMELKGNLTAWAFPLSFPCVMCTCGVLNSYGQVWGSPHCEMSSMTWL